MKLLTTKVCVLDVKIIRRLNVRRLLAPTGLQIFRASPYFCFYAVSFISERELKFMFAICHRPSVCRLSSVTFVRPTQTIEIFRNVFTP